MNAVVLAMNIWWFNALALDFCTSLLPCAHLSSEFVVCLVALRHNDWLVSWDDGVCCSAARVLRSSRCVGSGEAHLSRRLHALHSVDNLRPSAGWSIPVSGTGLISVDSHAYVSLFVV